MTAAPPPAPPYGVIVNVYLPLLTLSWGYVEVQGSWQETGRAGPQPWRRNLPVRMTWQLAASAGAQLWKTERP